MIKIYWLKVYLKVGNIYFNKNHSTYKWKVSNVDKLYSIVIPYLKTYCLVSQKRIDFEIFVKIVNIIRLKTTLLYKDYKKLLI